MMIMALFGALNDIHPLTVSSYTLVKSILHQAHFVI